MDNEYGDNRTEIVYENQVQGDEFLLFILKKLDNIMESLEQKEVL